MSKVTVKTTDSDGRKVMQAEIEMPWITKTILRPSYAKHVLEHTLNRMVDIIQRGEDPTDDSVTKVDHEAKLPEPKEDEPKKLDVQSGGLYFCDKKHCRFYTEHKDGLAIHKSRMHR